jgi:hypothetical protein
MVISSPQQKNGKIFILYILPTADCRPPTVDRRPLTVDRRPLTVDRRPSTTVHRLPSSEKIHFL